MTTDLKRNANVPPVLIRYFMNFRIRVHQDGNLERKRRDTQSTKRRVV